MSSQMAFEVVELVTKQIPDPPVESIRYAPGNCALLIGPAELLLGNLTMMQAAGLRTALLCTAPGDATRLPAGVRALAGQPAAITGWMGHFFATLRTTATPADLAPLSFHTDGHFDWVLDFTNATLTGESLDPHGYYRLPPGDIAVLKGRLLNIARYLREGFKKPRYYRFEGARCAHRRQGFAGCNACIDACAAKAISVDKDTVTIEPHLCQGCGTCATTCPSGAVRHMLPGTPVQLARLNAALSLWKQAGGENPGLWIGANPTAAVPDGWMAWPVDAVASLGIEFWLLALCLGATRVAIAMGEEHPPSRAVLIEQITLGRTLLAGLGFPSALARADDCEALSAIPVLQVLPTLAPPVGDDKRTLLFAALDHLTAQGTPATDAVDLSATVAPLGDIGIASERCTLCGVCVNICPASALVFPGTVDRIAFNESRCLQCGLCAAACPERAVSLVPRLCTTRSTRETPRIVAQAEMVACVECGDPFITRAMLARSREMMIGHPMFEGDKAWLMELCPACRQREIALAR